MASCTHLGFARVLAFPKSHGSGWSGLYTCLFVVMQPFLGSVCASSCRLPGLQPGPHPLRLAALELAVPYLGILGTWHDRGGVALMGWRTLG